MLDNHEQQSGSTSTDSQAETDPGISSKYEPLTDIEWTVLQRIAGVIIGEHEPSRRGRPRTDVRPLLNAFVHAISLNTSLERVKSSKMAYPSKPTLARYYKSMVQQGLMNRFVLLVNVSRPGFLEQYCGYKHKIRGWAPGLPELTASPDPQDVQHLLGMEEPYSAPDPEPVRGRAGIISPVPWGKPARPY